MGQVPDLPEFRKNVSWQVGDLPHTTSLLQRLALFVLLSLIVQLPDLLLVIL